MYIFKSAPSVGMSLRDTAVMVRIFCTGSFDKNAGLYAANQHPETLNGAIQHISRYQLNRRDAYGKVEDQLHRPARELVKVRVAQKHCHHGDYQAIDNCRRDYSPMWWSGGGSERKNYMREAPSWNKISDRPAPPEMDRRRDMSPAHKPSDRMLEKFMSEFTDRLDAIEARLTNRFDAVD